LLKSDFGPWPMNTAPLKLIFWSVQ
jgi:hypothetical protein